MTHLLDSIVIDTKPNPEVSVIWMHGLGDSGEGIQQVGHALSFLRMADLGRNALHTASLVSAYGPPIRSMQ